MNIMELRSMRSTLTFLSKQRTTHQSLNGEGCMSKDKELANRIYSFKNELKSMNAYQERLIQINNEIADLENQLNGVSSVPFDKELSRSENPRSDQRFFGIMMTIDSLIEERESVSFIINRAERILCDVKNPAERQMIRDLYVRKKNAENVAFKYGYKNKISMYRRINEILSTIL